MIPPTSSKNLIGIALMVLAVFLFCCMDIIVTYLGRQGYPTPEIMLFRTTVAIPLSLLYVTYVGDLGKLRSRKMGLQFVRCTTGTIAMFLVFYALIHIDVATVTALWSVNPLLVTLLSFIFLKERIGIHRWSAVILGFVGVLIISPPQASSWLLGIPLLAALCVAISIITLRILGKTETAAVSTFYFAVTSTAVALLLNIGVAWKIPTAIDTVLLVSTALFGTAALLLMTQALRFAEASLIMPIDYLGIVILAIMAYFLFHEVPSWQTVIGAICIVFAGIYTVYREIYRAKIPSS